jgi:putative exosortase-associated protein (TIGR04073 family)
VKGHIAPLAGVALVVAVLALASPAAAQTASRKFGRGLADVTTGFLELPGNTVVETEKNGAAAGIPIGMAKGLGMIVARELVGVYEIVSAPFPVPEGYRAPIRPEFPWQYFDGSHPTARSERSLPPRG